jgi:hypothetical protein
MWKEFRDAVGRLSGQVIHDILEIGVGIMSVEFGRLNQAHKSNCALAAPKALVLHQSSIAGSKE